MLLALFHLLYVCPQTIDVRKITNDINIQRDRHRRGSLTFNPDANNFQQETQKYLQGHQLRSCNALGRGVIATVPLTLVDVIVQISMFVRQDACLTCAKLARRVASSSRFRTGVWSLCPAVWRSLSGKSAFMATYRWGRGMWRPSLVGWRPSLQGWRPTLVVELGNIMRVNVVYCL